MKITEIRDTLGAYDSTYARFVEQHKLPPQSWFSNPDHFAIKCADFNDYTETIETVQREFDVEGMWQLKMDDRMLASTHLMGKVTVSGAEFSWIEVMQPRPGKESEHGFVEHTEFVHPDFNVIKSSLQKCGVEFTLQQNSGHKWINVVMDEDGREIKFNDKSLADVVVEERSRGVIEVIVPPVQATP